MLSSVIYSIPSIFATPLYKIVPSIFFTVTSHEFSPLCVRLKYNQIPVCVDLSSRIKVPVVFIAKFTEEYPVKGSPA